MLSVTATDRLDVLVDDLAARLGADPLPPLYDECIVVQSLSLRRWLQQRLAASWGCAAGLTLPFPAKLANELEQDCGLAAGDDDPWDRDRLRWRIAAIAERADAALAPLGAYLAAGHQAARPAKRLQLADRVADLLDSYQIYRPEMLDAWEAGRSWEGVEGHADEAWQAELWRRLRRAIPVEPRNRRFDALLDRLRRAGPPQARWRRISVLATGVLPRRIVDLLEALALHLPVGVWLTSPLPQPWGDVASAREAARRGGEAVGHPLVASLGRQARDWFRLIGARQAWADGWSWLPATRPAAATHLAHLQALVGERAVGTMPFAAGERSLAFACCHGQRREVEVARDAILAACAELPGLRPHDILVLAPDLTVYGPLIEAVFASADVSIRLPVRIADRTLGQTDAMAEGLLAILALAQGRCGLGEVLDLLELPAVRLAAGLAPEQVAGAHEALRRAGLRWGRDAGHRRRELGIAEVEDHGTLAAVLDRLALGWAMGPDAACGRPASGADGAPDHALLAALLSWMQRLLACVERLAQPRPLAAWGGELQDLVRALLQHDDLDGEVVGKSLVSLAGQSAEPLPITLAEIVAALATALGEEARASDFVSGSITVCGLKPMRMIPARMVVLLGMDDAGWPRRATVQPFDLVSSHPLPGDRQPREDDRQLFLEAVLAAGERLFISWPGRAAQGDPRHERPPSSCLGELFDAVDAAFATDGESRASERLTVVHPLQPFAQAYLAVSGCDAALPTWDAGAVALARRLAVPVPSRPAEPAFADRRPAETAAWNLRLDELERIWQDPAAAWCRARLGASPADFRDAIGDDEPFALDNLETYRLAEHLLAATDREAELDRAVADGLLPLGQLGGEHRRQLSRELSAIDAAMAAHRHGEPLAIAIDGPDWHLEGAFDPPPAGGVLRLAHPGAKVNERSRMALAIRLLTWNAWQVAHGEDCGSGEIIARGESAALPAHGPDAPERLARLIALARAALADPLPFFPRTAWKLHTKRELPADGLLGLANGATWIGDSSGRRGERELPSVALAWRGRDPIDDAAVRCMLEVWDVLTPAAQPIPAKPAKIKAPARRKGRS